MKIIKRLWNAFVTAFYVFVYLTVHPEAIKKTESPRPWPTNSGGFPARRNEDIRTESKRERGPK